MQLDWHDLKTNGSPALLRTLKQIEITLTQQEKAIAELQYLVSEEIIISLTPPAELREIIEELGNGWRIERQPASLNASAATSAPPAATMMAGTPGDSWLSGPDWVSDYAAATDGK